MTNRDQKPKERQRGFTLPEILMVVLVLAVLAVVIVPAIGNKARQADPSRVVNDVGNLRSAIDQFVADVRKYPNSVGQLTNPISTSVHPLTTTTNYGKADTARWKGPYLNKDSLTVQATGYSGSFKLAFDTCTLPSTGTTSTAGGVAYLIWSLPGPMDTTGWVAVDQAIDDGVKNTGSVRWSGTGTVNDTLKLLLVPIQP